MDKEVWLYFSFLFENDAQIWWKCIWKNQPVYLLYLSCHSGDKWIKDGEINGSKESRDSNCTGFLCSTVHFSLCAHHTWLSNARTEASNWIDAEMKVLGVTVRVTHAWSLDGALSGRRTQRLKAPLRVLFKLWNCEKEQNFPEEDYHYTPRVLSRSKVGDQKNYSCPPYLWGMGSRSPCRYQNPWLFKPLM
jgi:hypothetical protein